MSSVTPVPLRPTGHGGGRLTARDAWSTGRAVGARPLARETFVRFRYGDGFSHARALGLQLSLTAIPLVIALVGLSNELSSGTLGLLLRRTVLALTPGASDALLKQALNPLSDAGDDRGAELALWLGLLVALLSLITAMGQLERGANRIYGIQRDRPSVAKYRRAALLAVLAGLPAMAGTLLLVSAAAFGRAVEQLYGVDDDTVSGLAWPAGAALMLLAVVLMLRRGPRRDQPSWSYLVIGGATALVVWLLLTGLLGYYLQLSAGLGSVYGPLTGVLALLLWAQLTADAIFLGLALCAQLEAAAAGQLIAAAPDHQQQGERPAETCHRAHQPAAARTDPTRWTGAR